MQKVALAVQRVIVSCFRFRNKPIVEEFSAGGIIRGQGLGGDSVDFGTFWRVGAV